MVFDSKLFGKSQDKKGNLHDAMSQQQSAAPVEPELPRAVDVEKQDALEKEMLEQLQDLAVIKPFLQDDSVTDILINGTDSIYVEIDGRLQKTSSRLSEEDQVLEIANKVAETVGRKLNPNRPLVDARLLDGSRVNIIAPPLAVDGTMISIRKFSKSTISLSDMARNGNVSRALAEVLEIAGASRMNIVVSGGTGAGKTTLLNAMANGVAETDRIVTIEDSAELRLPQPHVIRLETKPLDVAPEEEVSIRDLVRNALRMRPDRIIVGEVRGPEAFDMMQAMNTGHEGSMTTIHANHPRDALARLENMVMMANLSIPSEAIRHQIASALNLIVQISRMRDGVRRVTSVCEVVGMENNTITMQDLFNFVPDGGVGPDGLLTGSHKWTGIIPRFVRRVAYWGNQERLEKALGVKLPNA